MKGTFLPTRSISAQDPDDLVDLAIPRRPTRYRASNRGAVAASHVRRSFPMRLLNPVILQAVRISAVILAVVVTTTSCGSSTPPSRVPASVGTQPSTPVESAITSAQPSSSAKEEGRQCETPSLQISLINSAAALGSIGGYLSFVNTGGQACELSGWPKIVGEPRASQVSEDRQVRAVLNFPPVTGVPTVILNPGSAAVAAFSAGDNPGPDQTSCPPPYRSLNVTPPGNQQSVQLSAWIPYANAFLPSCTPIEVTMVVPASFPGTEPPSMSPSGR